MDRAETVFGLGVLAVGVFLLQESLGMPYYRFDVPGPGFLPFWISLGVVASGVGLTVKAVRSRPPSPEERKWPNASGWMSVGLVLVAMAIALLLLETLGFLVVAALFVGGVTRGLGTRSWRVLASVPIVSALVLYGIFAVWLKVPLPEGILGMLG